MAKGLSEGVRQAVQEYLRRNPSATKSSLAGALGISRQALHAYLRAGNPATPRPAVLRRLSELTGGLSIDGWWCGPEQFQRSDGPVVELSQREFPFTAPVKITTDDRSVRAEVRRAVGDELIISVHLKLG